jgi:hypothetical protein
MPAPSPAAIVADPAPLNPSEFPFAVDPFPAEWLAEFGGVLPVNASGEAPPRELNPLRYE